MSVGSYVIPKFLRKSQEGNGRTFAYKSGWRVSEITGLTCSQVDLKEGIVWLEVGSTKNKEARVFYLDEELREVFKAQFANRRLGCKHVFHRDGKKIQQFRGAWNKACEEARIGKRLFHDFRSVVDRPNGATRDRVNGAT